MIQNGSTFLIINFTVRRYDYTCIISKFETPDDRVRRYDNYMGDSEMQSALPKFETTTNTFYHINKIQVFNC